MSKEERRWPSESECDATKMATCCFRHDRHSEPAPTLTPHRGSPPRGAPTFPALPPAARCAWLSQTLTCCCCTCPPPVAYLLLCPVGSSLQAADKVPVTLLGRSPRGRVQPVASPAFLSLHSALLAVFRILILAFVLPALACTRTEGTTSIPGEVGRRPGVVDIVRP